MLADQFLYWLIAFRPAIWITSQRRSWLTTVGRSCRENTAMTVSTCSRNSFSCSFPLCWKFRFLQWVTFLFVFLVFTVMQNGAECLYLPERKADDLPVRNYCLRKYFSALYLKTSSSTLWFYENLHLANNLSSPSCNSLLNFPGKIQFSSVYNKSSPNWCDCFPVAVQTNLDL